MLASILSAIVLDRVELNNNPAPVDLSHLSIEHLMPQTPKSKYVKYFCR